jgi:hypothetical protein
MPGGPRSKAADGIARREMTYRWSSGGEEDQGAEVSSALVGEGSSGVDQSTNTVGLDTRAEDGATP